MSEPIKLLLIDDAPGDLALLTTLLAEERDPAFQVEGAGRLREGLERLGRDVFDVVLLDLSLPESNGLDTFATFHDEAPDVPVVILTALDNDAVALEAVRRGAQDYLVKGQVDGRMLSRVLRYAIERHRMHRLLRDLAWIDELTGLYNRRGFLALAEHHMQLAKRTGRGSILLLADVDGLKQINDTFGHQEGDLALINVATVLKRGFRTSDIVARLSGDEFAVLAVQAASESAELLHARLREQLGAHNQQAIKYTLALSIGAAPVNPQTSMSLSELMARADSALYQDKQARRGSRKAP